MALTLLEKTGGKVSAFQGARENFDTGAKDGYADGYLNNLDIYTTANNSIAVDTGMLYIQGFRVENDELLTFTIPVLPSTPQPYMLIARLEVFTAGELNTITISPQPQRLLTKDNVFETGSGIYELELAQFIVGNTGITNFEKTIDYVKTFELPDNIVLHDTGTSTDPIGLPTVLNDPTMGGASPSPTNPPSQASVRGFVEGNVRLAGYTLGANNVQVMTDGVWEWADGITDTNINTGAIAVTGFYRQHIKSGFIIQGGRIARNATGAAINVNLHRPMKNNRYFMNTSTIRFGVNANVHIDIQANLTGQETTWFRTWQAGDVMFNWFVMG